MYLRNAFALAPATFALLSLANSAVALAGDSPKEVCLVAADQGQSFRDDGKYSAAREQFLTCSRDICPKLVHDQCTEWLHQLDEVMPTVIFVLKDDLGADVNAARVLIDGKVLANSLDGKPVTLDPGAHDVRFERDSPSQSVSVHVVLRTGEKNREISGAFPAAEASPSPSPEPTPEGTAPAPGPAAPPTESPEASGSVGPGRNIAAISMGVAGVAGLALGVVFALQSQHDQSQAAALRAGFMTTTPTKACDAPAPIDPANCSQLNDKVEAQNRDALISDVAYIAGGVLVAGALATWLLWPKPENGAHASTAWVQPIVDPHQAGLRLGGSF